MKIKIQVVERELEHEIHSLIFALHEGKVVGTLTIHRKVPGMEETPFAFDRWVDPKYRGTERIGRMLADAVREELGIFEVYVAHKIGSRLDQQVARVFEREMNVKGEFVRFDPNRNVNIIKLVDKG